MKKNIKKTLKKNNVTGLKVQEQMLHRPWCERGILPCACFQREGWTLDLILRGNMDEGSRKCSERDGNWKTHNLGNLQSDDEAQKPPPNRPGWERLRCKQLNEKHQGNIPCAPYVKYTSGRWQWFINPADCLWSWQQFTALSDLDLSL